jgi:hypothetical protein
MMFWGNYTPMELGMGVHLCLANSRQSKPRKERDVDILMAQEYLDALQEHINSAANEE